MDVAEPEVCQLRRPSIRTLVPLVMLALLASASDTLANGPGAVPEAAATAEQARIEAYWTSERLANAIPRDYIIADGIGEARAPLSAAAVDAVSGASWTGGGAINQRSGKVFFTFDPGATPGQADYVCSAAILRDGGSAANSLVLTAGHCAYDRATGSFATNWIFIPDWDSDPVFNCGSVTYGCWWARALVIRGEYVDSPDLSASIEHDYAIAVVGPGGKANTQLDALGSYPLRTSDTTAEDAVHVFGYPADTPYTGDDLVYCAGGLGERYLGPPYSFNIWSKACDMTGGASGGPWLLGSVNPSDGSGDLVSVSSVRSLSTPTLFGPKFDGRIRAAYTTAAGLAPDAVGIDHVLVTHTIPFTDIERSMFYLDITWVFNAGITTGCTATAYCPDGYVTREQMASFLARALKLTGTAPDAFTDDEASPHEPNINLVAKAGIATGCAATKYCPAALVSREQMASFLARALKLAGTAPDAFTDDEQSIHEPNINLVAKAGVATGCGAGKYCPTANVTRGQMAAFLHRAFGP